VFWGTSIKIWHANHDLEFRLQLHQRFWQRKPQSQPPVSFRIGDFFFSRHFSAALPLLKQGRRVEPEDIEPRDYLPDYEHMYSICRASGQTGFWTAEPFTGLPWLEAILGCSVFGSEEAFTSRPAFNSVTKATQATSAVLQKISGSSPQYWLSKEGGIENPWLSLFLRFVALLVEASDGRFTVGQPITRGLSDLFGALMGQTGLVFALEDEPHASAELIKIICSIFLEIMRLQRELVPPFHGGSCLGFYHVWAPGPSVWFQDDLAALLSPALYSRFFLPAVRRICDAYAFTAVHLHPSSFFILDELLDIDGLNAVEINKDIGGPSLVKMIPVLREVALRKCLILWGDITEEDLRILKAELEPRGLFLNIVAPDFDEAQRRNTLISQWKVT
jgi:hypothetical protein